MTAEWSGYNSSQNQIAHKTKTIFCLTLYRKYSLSLLLEKIMFCSCLELPKGRKLAMEIAIHLLLCVSCSTAEAAVFMELSKTT